MSTNTTILQNYFSMRQKLFAWSRETAIANKILLTVAMACVTGLLAQVRIPLPWTPVPITGETFAALAAGIFLGRCWGGASLALYLVLGIAGVPWFSGSVHGFNAIIGPTGGYLLGFVLVSLFLGHVIDKYAKCRNFLPMLLLMIFANFVLLYVPALIQLGLWMHYTTGVWPSVSHVVLLGLIPFIPGDIVKIAIAAGLTKAVTPKNM